MCLRQEHEKQYVKGEESDTGEQASLDLEIIEKHFSRVHDRELVGILLLLLSHLFL